MLNPKLIGAFIGLTGVVLLISGAYFTFQQMAFLDRSLETKAVVIDLHWEEEWVETEEAGYFTWVGWPVLRAHAITSNWIHFFICAHRRNTLRVLADSNLYYLLQAHWNSLI